MNAGKQENVSGIAIPDQGRRKIVELIANIAKIMASVPIFRSN